MVKYLITFVLLTLWQYPVFAQFQGFYNEKGQLWADTSFTINEQQQKIMQLYQQPVMVQIGSGLKYPALWSRNGVSDLTVIYSFTLNKQQKVESVAVEKVYDNLKKEITASEQVTVVREKLIQNFGLSLQKAFNLSALAPETNKLYTYFFPVTYKISSEIEKKGLYENRWVLQWLETGLFTDVICPGTTKKE